MIVLFTVFLSLAGSIVSVRAAPIMWHLEATLARTLYGQHGSCNPQGGGGVVSGYFVYRGSIYYPIVSGNLTGVPVEPPKFFLGGPYSGKVGQTITFDASGSYARGASIVSYEWDWNGDGIYEEKTTSAQATHSWPQRYSGQVGLRVTDSNGASSTTQAFVSITQLQRLNSTGFYLSVGGHRVNASMNVSENAMGPSGWLKFSYCTSAMTFYLNSTSINTISMSSDKTMVFQGTATVNNQPGYTFTATATDNGPPGTRLDQFGIEIKDSQGNVFFSCPLTTISIGDLVISTIE